MKSFGIFVTCIFIRKETEKSVERNHEIRTIYKSYTHALQCDKINQGYTKRPNLTQLQDTRLGHNLFIYKKTDRR
jgi:hypothetical protein